MTEDLIAPLKLLGWCRNIDDICIQRFSGTIFRPTVMQTLINRKLVKPYNSVYGWRLTRDGYRVLAEQRFPATPDAHTQRTGRRFEYAALTVTMYAAGINPFMTGIEDLRGADGYLPASALRAQAGRCILGSNQLAGLLRLQPTLYAAHFVSPDADRLVTPQREFDCLDAMMLGTLSSEGRLLFCGDTYQRVYSALQSPLDEEPRARRVRRATYAAFFGMAACPCCLLPCSRIGALQLRILQTPEYRRKLTELLTGNAEQTDLKSFPDCDFIDSKTQTPVHLVVDMELQSIERAAYQARRAGYQRILLVGLHMQNQFLKQYYRPPFYQFAEVPDNVVEWLEGGASNAPI